jgi:hypothetical protein
LPNFLVTLTTSVAKKNCFFFYDWHQFSMSPIIGHVLRLSRGCSRDLGVDVDDDGGIFGDASQLLPLALPQPPVPFPLPHSQSPLGSSAFGLARLDTLAMGQ